MIVYVVGYVLLATLYVILDRSMSLLRGSMSFWTSLCPFIRIYVIF